MIAQINQTSLNISNRNTQTVTDKTNYILIVADDLGFADLSFNGSTEIKTPNIDRLANTGVKFSEGYVSSLDIMPTFLELAGRKKQIGDAFDGVNLMPYIKKKNQLATPRVKMALYN